MKSRNQSFSSPGARQGHLGGLCGQDRSSLTCGLKAYLVRKHPECAHTACQSRRRACTRLEVVPRRCRSSRLPQLGGHSSGKFLEPYACPTSKTRYDACECALRIVMWQKRPYTRTCENAGHEKSICRVNTIDSVHFASFHRSPKCIHCKFYYVF